MTTRNEELAEQKEKKERSCNIIINGTEENKEQSDDALFVKNMIHIFLQYILVFRSSRIGRSEDKKKKPIKIVLPNLQEKEKILNNLRNLKRNTEYKGITITKDYTVSER